MSFQFLALVLLLWHPYDSDVGTFKDVLEVPKPLLIFLNCFFILFWLNVFLPSALNHWFESQFPSHHCWFPVVLFHIMQPSLLPGSFFMLLKCPVSSWSILITSVLNCAYDRLLSLHCLIVFFLDLWTILSFGLFFLVSAHLLCGKGQSLRCLPGWSGPLRWVVVQSVWEGSE